MNISPSPLRLDASGALPLVHHEFLHMGTSQRPDGRTLRVDSRSLLLNGKPWLPISGELHFSRIPQAEWRAELLKTKAGGIDLLASYVFWIHHEEVEGQWNWAGQRDLRRFAMLCGELDFPLVVRCGPWCHGEVRNGGFPDWVVQREGIKVRSDDAQYLDLTRRLYTQIAAQLEGLLWKDGGPVVGIQVENEFSGAPEHLVNLKRIAREAGLDVPLYTRTGWPELPAPVAMGELLPLFGAYAEGFWDRELTPMPGTYGANFLFRLTRSDAAVGTDLLGQHELSDAPDIAAYPYFCCEIGGGMMTSYHRRIVLEPQDVVSTALVKLGSGNNLQGYYMYHGGTNPPDALTTLQEAQNTAITNYNDLPVKSYDFEAPLGEFGQVNPHYHLLRRMHLFTRDFGATLATYPARLPEKLPTGANNTETLRWSVRSDGERGFVFVNNYHRLQPMPAHGDVQFEVKLQEGPLTVPSQPMAIPGNSLFFWPFHMDLGGAHLRYATAQPLCQLQDGHTTYVVFTQTPGVPAEFVFEAANLDLQSSTGQVQTSNGQLTVRDVRPGTGAALHFRLENSEELVLILLDEADSLTCYKGRFLDRERLVLTRAAVQFEEQGEEQSVDGAMRLEAEDAADLALALLPSPASISMDGTRIEARKDGLFARFTAPRTGREAIAVELELIQNAGPAREIPQGARGVAEAPDEADFAAAAVWRVRLPQGDGPDTDAAMGDAAMGDAAMGDAAMGDAAMGDAAMGDAAMGDAAMGDALLRVHYRGDVARFYLGDTLLSDNFYNGRPFELGLQRYAPEIYTGELLLKILPLRQDAPIYLPDEAKPDFGEASEVLEVSSVGFIERLSVLLTS
jgi:hypothetical protein